METMPKFWMENDQSVWLGSSLSLYRNVDKFFFTPKLASDQEGQVISLLYRPIQGEFTFGDLLKGEEVSPFEKEFWQEHFLLKNSLQKAQVGQGFLVDQANQCFVVFNVEDHLGVHILEKGGNLEEAYRKLVVIHDTIEAKVPFTYSETFGYETTDPCLAGCGLTVNHLLQVPALIQTGAFDEIEEDEFVLLAPFFSTVDPWVGDLVTVENRFCLGVTEENILSRTKSFVQKIVARENATMAKIQKEANPKIKDKISRSFALLKHSYEIEVKEALGALSMLKLGCSLGWIKGVNTTLINKLIFLIRRGHLMKSLGRQVVQEEILHKRAEFLHEALQACELDSQFFG